MNKSDQVKVEFRVKNDPARDYNNWSIVYRIEGDEEWFELDDPSREVCEIIVEALNNAQPKNITEVEERLEEYLGQ